MTTRILLVITGSIAAYKSLELIRRLRERGYEVRCVLTRGGAEFVTPLSVAALSENPVYSELFSLKDETEMGHIRLSREADIILVAPASADIIAKMATGRADDLASTLLLATDKSVLIAPAMNVKMWEHVAVQRNVAQLKIDGVTLIGPAAGDLACGEKGSGRLIDIEEIIKAVEAKLQSGKQLSGKHILITSGPTYEALDPVRFIGNRSSGKQGYAIAEALAARGATVTLVSGPTALNAPQGIRTIHVESAQEMLQASLKSLPADAAIFTAAVADWKPKTVLENKLKKRANQSAPSIALTETPDILATIAQHKKRPMLVIGFAAETEKLLQNATEKRRKKNCDWLLANDVSGGKIFGEEATKLLFITQSGAKQLPAMQKTDAAIWLAERITDYFTPKKTLKKVK